MSNLFKQKINRYKFYLASAFSFHSTNILLLLLSFLGFPYIAYHTAIISSIFILILSLLNAEDRNTIFIAKKEAKKFKSCPIAKRIVLLPALAFFGILVSSQFSNYSRYLIIAIILRKSLDWIDELLLIKSNTDKIGAKKMFHFLISQIFLYGAFIFALVTNLMDFKFVYFFLGLWALSPMILPKKSIINNAFYSINDIKLFNNINLSFYLSGFVLASSTLIFRILVLKNSNDIEAGNLISAFALGGLISSFATSPNGSYFVYKNKIKKKHFIFFLIPIIISIIICNNISELSFLNKNAYFWKTFIYSVSASWLMFYSQLMRNQKIQSGINLLGKDIFVTLINISLCIIFVELSLKNLLSMFVIFSSIVNYYFYVQKT